MRLRPRTTLLVLLASVISGAGTAFAGALPQTEPSPGSSCAAHHSQQSAAPATQADKPGEAESHHHQGVVSRGDHVMGFDHAKTTHHFALTKNGGSIEIAANNKEDRESVAAIRGHLPHIASMFSKGDFDAPMLIHDRVPPGVPTMKRLPAAIAWKYEDSAAGGRVVATTRDPEALSALHAFLAFQIEDHGTGDSLAVR